MKISCQYEEINFDGTLVLTYICLFLYLWLHAFKKLYAAAHVFP